MTRTFLKWSLLGTVAVSVAGGAACSSTGGGGQGAEAGEDAAVETGGGDDSASPSDGSAQPDATLGEASVGEASAEGGAADASAGEASADGGGLDAPVGDAALDGGGDGGACTSAQLLCSGICVANDALNCGTCGNDCTTLHATSSPGCVGGQCTFPSLTCAAHWGHCSSQASDGCETDLTTAAHCGSCGVACTSPPICAAGTGDAGASSCVQAQAVAVGYDFTTALLSSGSVYAWGGNAGGYNASRPGQLGNGSSAANALKPGPVSNATTATAIAAGDGHACALLAGGTVECWGDNTNGQLGTDPGVTPSSRVPVAVAGLTNVLAVDVGVYHSCALISGGTVKCWGSNNHQELGNTTTTATCSSSGEACTATPTTVPGVTSVTAIAVGADVTTGEGHTCALLANHTVECWGDNTDQDLGLASDGGAMMWTALPSPVQGISTAVAIQAHATGACALLSDATVKCWGGVLGNGTGGESAVPVPVSGLTGVVSLSAGSTAQTVCAVRSDHTAMCWGSNLQGQLGNGAASGSLDSSDVPVQVSGLTNVTQMAAGYSVTCARLSTGNVTCWGFNNDDNLANASATGAYNSSPVAVQW
jgi:alpha-tubulin suppressor-like RCC1 family protein